MAEAFNPLDTLRQAFNPKDDVKFELKVNEHPKGHTNKSIVNAINMKLSDDGVVLENDNKIEEVDAITAALNEHYGDNKRKIVHVLPCNRELVLFVARDMNTIYTSGSIDIWRYSEESNTADIFYSKGIPWYGGSFSSTFTYTSNNSLIIAFCEHDSIGFNKTYDCPLRTINLGDFNKSNNVFNDRDIEPYKTPLCPEVCLPQISDDYKNKGKSYVGNYYFYIRYKINNYDYTQWYNFGYPIINEYRSNKIIHKKVTSNKNNEDFYGDSISGAYPSGGANIICTYLNDSIDLINNSIYIKILHKNILYNKCQIGYICTANNYTKYYRTDDIALVDNMIFNTDINNLVEEQFNISSYENYFNVKNIINVENKLYISNYTTFNDSIDIKDSDINNIKLHIKRDTPITIDDSSWVNVVYVNDIAYNADLILKQKSYSCYTNIVCDVNGKVNDSLSTKSVCYGINLLTYLTQIGKTDIVDKKYYYIHNIGNRGRDRISKYSYRLDELDVVVVKGNVKLYNPNATKPVNILYLYSNNANKPLTLSIDKTYDLHWHDDNNVNNFEIDIYNSSNKTWTIYDNDIFFSTSNSTSFTALNINLSEIVPFDNTPTSYYMYTDVSPKTYISFDLFFNNVSQTYNKYFITSLVEGEIYDFYIHFIDKYGNTTNGYKLTNNNNPIKFKSSDTKIDGYYCTFKSEVGIVLIPFNDQVIAYTKNPIDDTYDQRSINITKSKIYKLVDITKNDIANLTFTINYSAITDDEFNTIKNELTNILKLDDSTLSGITFGDIIDTVFFQQMCDFLPFINNKGDKLFKIPLCGFDSHITPLGITVSNISNICNRYGFVGYFISHKKLERTYTLDGIGNERQINNILLNTSDYNLGNICKTFIISTKTFNSQSYVIETGYCYLNRSSIYGIDYNKLIYADSGVDKAANRQTMLLLSNNEAPIRPHTPYIRYVKIMNLTKNIYTNKEDYLYRLGNINYDTDIVINKGLNGIIKNHTGILYGDENYGVSSITTSIGKASFGNVNLYDIFSIYDDNSNIPYIDEEPYRINIYERTGTDKAYKYGALKGTELFYDVIQTLTFIKYKSGNIHYSNPNIYVMKSSINYINEFNNTIYRSNVISDEGRVNNWRYFESNAYKNINENKGFITNLVHIGKYLYVHTQHSLFAFNNDAALEMNNKNLQVATPDLFDTEYSEAYLTNLGYGGLQDKESSIVGTFGYMYYNRDNNEIIKIYSTEKKIITDDIKTLFNNLNVKRVMFMNDSVNNRVFIQITHQYTTPLPTGKYKTHTQYIVLSYNYKANKFISLHSTLKEPITQEYAKNGDVNELNVDSFRYAVNTKDTLYMFNNDDFKHSLYKFGKGYNNLNKVSIIFNKYYDTIKYVEYLVYKLRKTNNVVNDAFNFNRLPVEKEDIPYSGVGIRIYNDLVDTGWIDVRQANTSYKDVDNTVDNYSKPYYQLGNWIFNFVRTESITDSEGNVIPTRLFGNYFVVEFSFGINTEKIEFEFTDLTTSKDKRI